MPAEINLRRAVDLIIDVGSGKLTDNANLTSTVPDQEYDFGSQILFRAQLRRGGAAFEVPTGSVFYFCIDNTFSSSSPDLVNSLHAQFNVSGDWTEAGLAGGKISWRADLASSTLKTALATAERATMFAELWMQAPGASYSKIGRWKPVINNSVADIIGTATPVGPTYATIDSINARLGEGIQLVRRLDGKSALVVDGVEVQVFG